MGINSEYNNYDVNQRPFGSELSSLFIDYDKKYEEYQRQIQGIISRSISPDEKLKAIVEILREFGSSVASSNLSETDKKNFYDSANNVYFLASKAIWDQKFDVYCRQLIEINDAFLYDTEEKKNRLAELQSEFSYAIA